MYIYVYIFVPNSNIIIHNPGLLSIELKAIWCYNFPIRSLELRLTEAGIDSLYSIIDSAKAIAEGLLRTVMKHAEILHEDPANYDSRAEIMWAGSLAHNGLTGCGSDGGDWATHLLEHEMGGMFDVTHGAGLAAIWSSWARYVMKDCLPRFVKWPNPVWEQPAEE